MASRAVAKCKEINQWMEEAKKTLLETARCKNKNRQAHEFESFVRNWCRDPAPPVELMDAYVIGCYGAGAMYLVAYHKGSCPRTHLSSLMVMSYTKRWAKR